MGQSSTSFVPNDPRLMGNKSAVGNEGGRPGYDRIAVGNQFIQWVLDHPDCLTVPHFTTANNYSTPRLLEWVKENPEFRELYIKAKELIGVNRLNATRINEELEGKKPLDKTIYLRHVGNFDSDKRAFDREEKAYDAQLKKDILQDNTDYIVKVINYAKDNKIESESKDNNHTPA